MSIGTLYTPIWHPYGRAIRAAAALDGLQIDIPSDYKHFETNLTPDFRSKFPHGKIPAFEGKDGFLLTESYAIARYVASFAPNSGLLTGDLKKDALIDQWACFALTEIAPHEVLAFQLVKGMITPYNKPIHQDANNKAARAFRTLNVHLASNTFLVGERITLADLIVASTLSFAFTVNFDAELRKELPHVVRHYETVVNQPALKDIFGPLEFIEKPLAFVPPPKEKKEVPKAEKPAPKPKPAAEADDEEDDRPREEPKPKHPCDSLPKSTFNLEDWKRYYSNNETREGSANAIDWFYKNYDPEGFSVWSAKYKYPEELTQVFMSNNLIGGFFNRLEGVKKYSFGSMGVLGTDNDSLIWGTFVVRGQDARIVLDAAPDLDSFEIKKLDFSNAEDKEFFEGALAWDLAEKKADGTPGRAWNSTTGKNLK